MKHKLLFPCAFLLTLAPAPALTGTRDAGEAREVALVHALFALGTKYRYGGRSPETGFDCSGLIAHVYEAAWGLALPHSAKMLSRSGRTVESLGDLQPGDLSTPRAPARE
jgi:cell wall-associated NlpC family hydrolase